MLDTDDLKTFDAFARTLNFTHAAAEVYLTQPAVHGIVARLSSDLGVPLYVRRGRTLRLTEAGRQLALHARDALEREERLRAAIRGEKSSQPLVLAAGEGAFLHLLGPGLRAYLRGGRRRLRLLTRDGEGALDAVRTGEAHVGVGVLPAPPDGLHSEALADVGAMLAMPRRHRLAVRKTLELRHFAGEPFIAPPAGRPLRTRLEEAFATEGRPLHVAVEASGWALMLEFVSLGLGVALVNEGVRLPAGVVARPVPSWPKVRYRLFSRFAPGESEEADRLRRELLRTAV